MPSDFCHILHSITKLVRTLYAVVAVLVCLYLSSVLSSKLLSLQIGHVNNIPAMQFFTGISRNTQSKSDMLSFTECIWELINNALWDTH